MQQYQLALKQFGENAHAYLGSSVHARGEDLEYLRQLLANAKDSLVLDLGSGAGQGM